MVRKLEAAPVTMTAGTPNGYLAVRDRAMHSLGVGTTHDMNSVLRGIFWPSLRSTSYTPGEKVRLRRGPIFEEPQKARRISREDVLAGKVSLADGSSV
jgi:hypothetical protein